MNKVRLVSKVNYSDIPKAFITVMNGLMRLSDREIEVLSELIKLKGEEVLNTKNRKYIQQILNLSQYNLNNIVKSLRNKGIIIENGLSKNLSYDGSKSVSVEFVIESTE